MTAEPASSAGGEFACFEAGGSTFAVDVMRIREIVRDQAATPLPGSPAAVDGVIDLRGCVLPVVDLGRALGGAPVERSARARIAVLEVGALVLGLRVEAATDVVAVGAEELEPAPSLGAGRPGPVCAVLRRAGEAPALVLAVERLVEALRGPSAAQEAAA